MIIKTETETPNNPQDEDQDSVNTVLTLSHHKAVPRDSHPCVNFNSSCCKTGSVQTKLLKYFCISHTSQTVDVKIHVLWNVDHDAKVCNMDEARNKKTHFSVFRIPLFVLCRAYWKHCCSKQVISVEVYIYEVVLMQLIPYKALVSCSTSP